MEIRRATIKDLDILIKNRIKFVSDIGRIPSPEVFSESTSNYFKNHIEKDDLIIWLAVDKDEIVATVELSIYEIMPTLSSMCGKTGYLLNVWTDENYRRQGLATMLLNNTIEDSKKAGVMNISLKATEQGKPVYEKLGFKSIPNGMEIKL